jgi:hypothetical protein
MPTISRFYGILIIMFYREGFNEKPHFHVRYNEYDAKVSIDDSSVIKGNLPGRAYSLVKEWTNLHKDELLENWSRIKKGEQLKKIEPLA